MAKKKAKPVAAKSKSLKGKLAKPAKAVKPIAAATPAKLAKPAKAITVARPKALKAKLAKHAPVAKQAKVAKPAVPKPVKAAKAKPAAIVLTPEKRKIILEAIRAKATQGQAPKINSKLSALVKGQVREEKELRHIDSEQQNLERQMKALDKLAFRESILIKRIAEEEKRIEQEERRIEGMLKREDRVLAQIGQKEEEISDAVMKMGSVIITRSQFIDITRAVAGAFLAFGLSLRYFDVFSMQVSSAQFVGLLAFVLITSTVLLYLREREQVAKLGKMYLLGRVAALYIICLAVELVSFGIFGMIQFNNLPLLAEMLVVGSYVTMAGAVAFSLL